MRIRYCAWLVLALLTTFEMFAAIEDNQSIPAPTTSAKETAVGQRDAAVKAREEAAKGKEPDLKKNAESLEAMERKCRWTKLLACSSKRRSTLIC